MSTRQHLESRAAFQDELKAIHAAHPDELPPEAQARWDELTANLARVEKRISRQSVIDETDLRIAGQPVNGTGDRHLDRELRNFSLVRAIASQVPNLDVDAGREREISQEIARRAGRPFQGMAVPMAVFDVAPETRVTTTTTPSGGPGSNIIATDYRPDQYISLLHEALVIRGLGARVLSGLVGNVAIPRQTGSATAAWVNENSVIPVSDLSFDQITLTPKHVGARTEYSRNMLLQSSPDIELLVRQDFAAVLAKEIDRAALVGSGTPPEPRGVLNTSGIAVVSMGTNGAALTYDAVVDLIGSVEDAYANGTNMGFVSNRKVKRAILKVKDTTNVPLGADVIFQGTRQAFVSTIPSNLTKGTGTNLSALIYGNWSDLLLGYWSSFDLLVNPYESTAYSKGNVQVRGMCTMDVAVRHPESFAAIKDIVA